ncbi:MAG: acetyl-CoA carboxylase biotin carboxyl carrier protein subunit [Acidobacteriota bacterium]|nr:acetyl-CoA carboxylase biotin carboxyl carrier protein subunit [Acidobacteriota bacterium]
MKPDIAEVEPGVYSILLDGASYEARVAGSEIVINGCRFPFEADDPRQWKRRGGGAAGSGRASLAAPMPGKVVRVLAVEGDEVRAGQGIVVVEAMKMQNEMKSPRDGRVISVAVKPGDSVNAGAVLATIE